MTTADDRTDLQTRIRDAAWSRRDAVVELTSRLVGFDTTARGPEDPPRQEAALQDHLATRLRAAGAEVELLAAGPGVPGSERQVPADLSFDGRPQLVARFASSSGGGRSLIFNGHIDAVSAEPVEEWSHDPFDAIVRDGLLYGRGTCDMKGGVAAMVVAAEMLAELRHPLAGRPDRQHGHRRGVLRRRRGGLRDRRAARRCGDRAGADQPADLGRVPRDPVADDHRPRPAGPRRGRPAAWRDGGAVNAIDKMMVVLEELPALQADWISSPAHAHPTDAPAEHRHHDDLRRRVVGHLSGRV